MKINLKDFGGFLSSPDLGKRIAVSVLDSIRKEPDVNVIMDFSGVQGVSKHFCEEFLSTVFRGIGYDEFKRKVVIQNQAIVVKMVFDSVINQKKEIPKEGIEAVIGEPIHTVYSDKTPQDLPKDKMLTDTEKKEVTKETQSVEEQKPVLEVEKFVIEEKKAKVEEISIETAVEKTTLQEKKDLSEEKKPKKKAAQKTTTTKKISKGIKSTKSEKKSEKKEGSKEKKTIKRQSQKSKK